MSAIYVCVQQFAQRWMKSIMVHGQLRVGTVPGLLRRAVGLLSWLQPFGKFYVCGYFRFRFGLPLLLLLLLSLLVLLLCF